MIKNYEQELLELIYNDNYKLTKEDILECLNSKDFDVNKEMSLDLEDSGNFSPKFLICEAIMNSSYEIVETLIEYGARLDCFDAGNYINPINLSATYDRLDVLKLLIDCKADLLGEDCFGYTALVRSTLNNNSDIVKLLLENYDDSDRANLNKSYALFRAVGANKNEIAKLLLENNANPNLRHSCISSKITPLALIVKNSIEKKLNIKLIDLLINYGAEIGPSDFNSSEKAISEAIQQRIIDKEIKINSAQISAIKKVTAKKSKIGGLKI